MATVLEPPSTSNRMLVDQPSLSAPDARHGLSSTTSAQTTASAADREDSNIRSSTPRASGAASPSPVTGNFRAASMALTQSLPGNPSTSSGRPRLGSLARSSPSLAYPEDQPYSATTASKAGAPKHQSAWHSLQAAVTPPPPQGGTSPPLTSSTNALPASSSRRSQTRANSFSSAARQQASSFSTPTSPAESSSRRRSYLGSATSLPHPPSSSVSSHTLTAFTSLEEAAAQSPASLIPTHDSNAPTGARISQPPTPSRKSATRGRSSQDDHAVSRLRKPSVSAGRIGQLEAKVVILGAQGVGKTSIVHRYTSGQFSASSVPSTIGASFLTKKLIVDDVKCRLQIWDTAGQERFRSMAPMYYRGSHAAVIVYDVTSFDSFADVKTWIDELRRNMGGDLIIHVVGSKVDLAPIAREVDRDEAHEQVLRWLYPDRELASLRAVDQVVSPPSRGAGAGGHGTGSVLKQSTGVSQSRLGTLGSLAIGSASRIAEAFPSTSRSNTVSKSTALFGSSSSSGGGGAAVTTASNGSSGSDGSSPLADCSQGVQAPFLPGDDSEVEVSEVSAKDGEGIEEVFLSITQRLVLQRAAIEEQRRERNRTSIFLSAADDRRDADNVADDGLQDGQRWTCC